MMLLSVAMVAAPLPQFIQWRKVIAAE